MKKNKYGLIAGIGVGVILAIGGMGVASIVNKNNKQNVEVVENNKENIVAGSNTSKKSTKQTNKQQDNEATLIAEKFINDYFDPSIEWNDWLATQPITEKFRKTLKERSRYIELSEKALNEVKLTKKEEAERNSLGDKSSAEYDPLFGAAILDIGGVEGENTIFKAISWDEKTGIVVLKDTISPDKAVGECNNGKCEPIIMEINVKLVKSGGKWLVDDIK